MCLFVKYLKSIEFVFRFEIGEWHLEMGENNDQDEFDENEQNEGEKVFNFNYEVNLLT